MINRNLCKFLLVLILSDIFFTANSQCYINSTAVSDVTLQCSGGTSNRSAVAFYPTQNIYYSVNQGSSSNPIETFSYTGGAHLSSTLQTADYNGFWYNFNLGILEGNVFNQSSIIQHSINPVNSFALATTSIVAPASMPASQSCGQFDLVNNQIIYYNASTLYKYSRTTGALSSFLTIMGLPSTSINSTSIIYLGIPGSEVGVYDYLNKRIYFINYATGVYSGSCQLPSSAPTPTSLGVSYANNRLFLFDSANLRWFGYRLSNRPDIHFYGNNILCKFQESFIAVNDLNNEISTYTWAPAPALIGNLPSGGSSYSGVPVSMPTVTTIYSVAVTNTSACSNTSNFVMTVYPNTINNSIFMIGSTDSLFCTNLTSVTLTAAGEVTYTWTTWAQTNSIVVSPTTTTEYRVVGTNTMGCISSIRFFTVFVYGGPTITVNSSPTVICGSQTATLTASGANSYTWSNNLTTSSISISPTVTSGYSVTGENTIGCKQIAEIYIPVGIIPSLNPKGKLICKGGRGADLLVNSTNGPASYTWSTGEVNYILSVQPTITTSYTVYATNFPIGCTNSAVVTVTVSDCLGIDDPDPQESQITIYPNPNEGRFKISFSSISENSSIEIYDTNGKSVYLEKVKDLENEVDLTPFPQGLYILVYSENTERKITRKIITK